MVIFNSHVKLPEGTCPRHSESVGLDAGQAQAPEADVDWHQHNPWPQHPSLQGHVYVVICAGHLVIPGVYRTLW